MSEENLKNKDLTVRTEILGLCAVWCIGLFVRVWFAQLPLVVLNEGDPNTRVQQALQWATNSGLAHGLVWPPLHSILLGIPTLFGADILIGSRVVTLLFGVFTLPLFYLLVKNRFGQKNALISCLLLAINPFHVKHSVITMAEVPFFFAVVGALYFLFKYIKTDGRIYFVMSSLCLNAGNLLRFEGWQVAFYITFFMLYYKRDFKLFVTYGAANALSIAWYMLVAFCDTGDPLYGLSYTAAELKASYAKVPDVPAHILAGLNYAPIFPFALLPVMALGVYYGFKKRIEIPWLLTGLLMLLLITYRVLTCANEPFWRYFSTGLFLLIPFLVIGMERITRSYVPLQLVVILLVTGYSFAVLRETYASLYNNAYSPAGLRETAAWFLEHRKKEERYYYDTPGFTFTGFHLLAYSSYSDMCYAHYPYTGFTGHENKIDSVFNAALKDTSIHYVIAENGTLTDSLMQYRALQPSSAGGVSTNFAYASGIIKTYRIKRQ